MIYITFVELMPSFKIIGVLVLDKKGFKGFCYLPSWSCDRDHLYKLSFLTMIHMKFGFDCLNMFEYYGHILVKNHLNVLSVLIFLHNFTRDALINMLKTIDPHNHHKA